MGAFYMGIVKCVLLPVLLLAGVLCPMASGEDVWALRSRFTLSTSGAAIEYAEDDAQWRVRFNDGTVAANNVEFALELENEAPVRSSELTKADVARESVAGPFGESSRCVVTFEPRDGIQVRHHFTFFTNRPFILMGMSVTNVGAEPKQVARLSPAVFRDGTLTGVGEGNATAPCPLRLHGGVPVPQDGDSIGFIQFSEGETGRRLALGVLGMGAGDSSLRLAPTNHGWQGAMSTVFEPAQTLQPGVTLESDLLWVSADSCGPEKMALFFGWATATAQGVVAGETPRTWVSVEAGEDLDDLQRMARAYQPAVVHALVPASWNSPGERRTAATKLNASGVMPGLALDPLAVDGGPKEAVVRDSEGRRWLNPTHPQATEAMTDTVRSALRMGYAFLAAAPTQAPDDALTAMGLSRGAADSLALKRFREAAGRTPVVVAGAGAQDVLSLAWREAEQPFAKVCEYGGLAGTLRAAVGSLMDLDDATAAAIAAWPGGLELVGMPKADVRRGLIRVALAGRGGPRRRPDVPPAE